MDTASMSRKDEIGPEIRICIHRHIERSEDPYISDSVAIMDIGTVLSGSEGIVDQSDEKLPFLSQ